MKYLTEEARLTLGVLEVVPPQGTNLVLATHIPHGEADVLVLHGLHIETCFLKEREKKRERKKKLSALGVKELSDGSSRGGKLFPHTPIVGMVVTISPSLSLYRMVVFPAASRPTMRILISFLPMRLLSRLPNMFPMMHLWLLICTATKLCSDREGWRSGGVRLSRKHHKPHSN